MKINSISLTVLIAIAINTNAQWTEPSPVAWNSQNVYSLASDGTNIFAGTGSAGVSLSTNNGNNWTAVNTGLTSTGINALAINGTTVFAAGYGVFLSTNNGTNWTSVSTGLIDSTVNALAISGTTIFAGTDKGVFLSTNNGMQWTAANTGHTSQVRALAISGTAIFAGAYNGVYLSTNNGGLWTKVVNGLTNTDVVALAISGNTIFAGTGGGVFMSTNNGSAWTAINSGLTNLNVYALHINGSTIFAGTDGGVFYSTNMGANWTSFNNGFPANTAVQAFTTNGAYIYAGIRLSPYGVWRRSLSEVPTGAMENRNDHTLTIYPNPADNIVNLKINETYDVNLTMQIYTVNGILVKSELLKENRQQMHVGDLSNGIYIVKILSGEWTKEQKLIINR